MAPAVPFALLGVVELTAVAVWLGLAAAACFPRLRRPATPLLVLGALGMAGAEAVTSLRFGVGSSQPLGAVRLAALVLLAVGLGFGGLSLRALPLPAVVVPLGAPAGTAVLGAVAGAAAAAAGMVRGRRSAQDRRVVAALTAGLLLTALAVGLAGAARHHVNLELTLLSARAAASLCFAVLLVSLARTNLVGKVVGAIIAAVVVMAVAAVAVVGAGMTDQLPADRAVLRRLLVTALVVLVLVAACSVVLARRIAEPLQRLTVAAGQVRRGDLDAPVSVHRRDEVGSLARAFDEMTASLRGLTGDLRESAEQEAALRARMQTVVASMTDGLLTTDGTGAVTSANSRALDLLGLLEPEVVGRPLAEVADVRDVASAPLLAGGSRLAADGALRRADGSELPVRVAVAPLEDGAGQVVLLADRTREREVEQMKTEFLANVSHELRTPLTPIRGYAELLTRNPHLSSARAQEFLAEILASAARMSRAVDLLVDVAALEAGRVTPVRRTVPVESVVTERLAAWRSRYPDRAADLRRRVEAGLPDLEVDPYWLDKALDELMDNAVKYSPAGSAITLQVTAADGGTVRLAVRDNGAGVDTTRLAELLGDFSQADGSETRSSGGMGLGLGFVSRVAEPLGMTVRVSSLPGRGSEFGLDVPTSGPGAE